MNHLTINIHFILNKKRCINVRINYIQYYLIIFACKCLNYVTYDFILLIFLGKSSHLK
jgi:hypothetical protein